MLIRRTGLLLSLAAACILFPNQLYGYGPVGHMRVVIESWPTVFQPVLGAPITDKDMIFAALAGAVSSDIGYVKSNARDFTDSVHYVRSGDFVAALIQNAQSSKNKKLLAFALGFGTHYWADRYGHYSGTNRLVAMIKNAQWARFTYEEDPCTHTWVETQLSLFDLQDAPSIAFTSFVDSIGNMHGDVDAFLTMAYGLLRDTAEQVYPGTRIVFGAMDLFRFLRFVAASISITDEIGNKMFGAKAWRGAKSASSERIVADAEKQEDEASGLTKLRDDLTHPLPLNREEARTIYVNSLNEVRSHMGSLKGAWPNFNLDTNLLSQAGQYRCADAAFNLAARRMTHSSGTPPDANTAEFDRVARQFQDSGVETRWLFSEPAGIQAQSVLFHNPELDEAADAILFDIEPQAASAIPVSTESVAKCPATADISLSVAGQTYELDWSKRVLCVPETARVLDELYAHFLAGEMLRVGGSTKPGDVEKQKAESVVGPRYAEALDRTRLNENVNSYPTSGCPSCTGRLHYP
jgi:Zinc dependent phospholipase C